MKTLIEQIFAILTTFPGTLIFDLVLLLAVFATMLIGIGFLRLPDNGHARRNIRGLYFLLFIQFLHLIYAILPWQQMSVLNFLPGPLDRFLLVLSFIWIISVWMLPSQKKNAAWAPMMLSATSAALLVFTAFFWQNPQMRSAFNNTVPDWIWSIFLAILLLGASMAVRVQKTAGWGLAFIFLMVNLVGIAMHFVWGSPAPSVSAALRFSMLISFPLLPGYVSIKFSHVKRSASRADLSDGGQFVYPSMKDWLGISALEKNGQLSLEACQLVTHDLGALACIWLNRTSGDLTTGRGFAQEPAQAETHIQLEARQYRGLFKALMKPQASSNERNASTRDELDELGRLIGISRGIDQVIIYPIQREGKNFGAFLLVYAIRDEHRFRQIKEYFQPIETWLVQQARQNDLLESLSGKNEAMRREVDAARYQLTRQGTPAQAPSPGLESPPTVAVNLPANNDNLLMELIDEAVESVSTQMLEKGINLKLVISKDLPACEFSQTARKTLAFTLRQLFIKACQVSSNDGTMELHVQLEHVPVIQYHLQIKIQPNSPEAGMNGDLYLENSSLQEIVRSLGKSEIYETHSGNLFALHIVIPK